MYKKESLESVYSSNSRLNLLNKRKRLSAQDMTSQAKGDRFVAQRVLSAKAHRVKMLQNQLADAHYHLQELSNENKMLRAIQKKQEIALQRYENSNAELPSVLSSHTEEMRFQQTKYKQLKQQFKETSQKLKERDLQYQQMKDEHQHLMDLSKDRNLLDREKLQAQVQELTAKNQQQSETIAMLQRRIVLEAKNFRYQLHNEISKHKDTRHDLDLAINNADKLTTIIGMKEKMLSTVASRSVKSPVKSANSSRPPAASKKTTLYEVTSASRGSGDDRARYEDRERSNLDQLSKLCENSRNITSSLSHDEDTSSSMDARSRYRSRTNSNSTRSTPNPPRKSSKASEDNNINDLAKAVQDGMADLSIFDELDRNTSPDDMQKKIEIMKADLMKKIKTENEKQSAKEDKEEKPPMSRKSSFIRRQSTEESIEEQILEEERPKSRGRRNSSVSFYEGKNATIEETTTVVAINDKPVRGDEIEKYRRDSNTSNKEPPRKQIDQYCNEIIQDIEKSTKVIDKHMKQLNYSKYEGDKLVEQLQMVDKLNDLVSSTGEIPKGTLEELNNNFKMLTDTVFTDAPTTRKRSVTSRRGSKSNDVLGDFNLSNQDLLNDLLGRK